MGTCVRKASAAGSVRINFPNTSFDEYKSIKLEGTEKQVKWAESLRETAAKELYSYAFSGDVGEYTDHGYLNEWFESYKNKSNRDLEVALQQYGYTGVAEINKINVLGKRISAVNDILSNQSAKYWIDNRDNTYQTIDSAGKIITKDTKRRSWLKRIDEAGKLPK